MRPTDLRDFREKILHTRIEFADLLGRLRGVPVSPRNVENWELGLIDKPIPVYQTDLEAISRATTPLGHQCEECGIRATIRKNDRDLCASCASPLHLGQRPRAARLATA